jgi:transcriptional regulator with XRE-family HTH domain
MGRKTAHLTPTLQEILRTLGENLHLARLRRRISTTMLAERAGMSRTTLRSIERGDSGVTLGAYANVLFCLGLEKDLLLVGKDDSLGRKLQDAGLTHTRKRISRKEK